jgi:hypothetical protein
MSSVFLTTSAFNVAVTIYSVFIYKTNKVSSGLLVGKASSTIRTSLHAMRTHKTHCTYLVTPLACNENTGNECHILGNTASMQ